MVKYVKLQHPFNGSPVVPSIHLHSALSSVASQTAFVPHVIDLHGSVHTNYNIMSSEEAQKIIINIVSF